MKSIIYIIITLLLLSVMSCGSAGIVVDPTYPDYRYYYNPYGEYWYRPFWYDPFWRHSGNIYYYYPRPTPSQPNSRYFRRQSQPQRSITPSNRTPSRSNMTQPQRSITPSNRTPPRSNMTQPQRSISPSRSYQPQRQTTPSRRGGN